MKRYIMKVISLILAATFWPILIVIHLALAIALNLQQVEFCSPTGLYKAILDKLWNWGLKNFIVSFLTISLVLQVSCLIMVYRSN